MQALSYSSVRKNFVKTMEQVCDEHEPLIITRRNAPSVIMVSLEDYEAIKETNYLLRHPANAKNLRESIRQYEAGKVVKKGLIEE